MRRRVYGGERASGAVAWRRRAVCRSVFVGGVAFVCLILGWIGRMGPESAELAVGCDHSGRLGSREVFVVVEVLANSCRVVACWPG